MRRVECVGIALLALGLSAAPLYGQTSGGEGPPGEQETGFRLKQNFPNPFNPTTTIPFELDQTLFEGGKPAIVTIRIYNVLQQWVATPVALHHPGGRAEVSELVYTSPGEKQAFWDGLDRNGRKVASGVYYALLVVNGRRDIKKMVVLK